MNAWKLVTYQDWRYCIQVKCGIPLSEDFVQKRIVVLSDTVCDSTRKFVREWGDEHRQRVLAWFQRAAAEQVA